MCVLYVIKLSIYFFCCSSSLQSGMFVTVGYITGYTLRA